MPQLVLDVLPFAVGVFASPLPVILAIIMLFTPEPRRTSMVYDVTWVVGLIVVTVIFTLLAGALQDVAGGAAWLTWIRILAGLALIAIAVRTWLGRSSEEPPAWLAGLMQAGPKEAFRFGVLMSAANPKELLMAIAAGVAIGTSDAALPVVAAAFVVFIAVGALSVIAPMAVFLMGGEGSLARLRAAREWLEKNNASVASAVLLVLGVWLVLGGLLKL